MKHKMKFTALLLAFTLVMSACSQNTDEPTNDSAQETTSEAASTTSDAAVADDATESTEADTAQADGELTKEEIIKRVNEYYKDAKSISYDAEATMNGMEMTMDIAVDENHNMKVNSSLMGSPIEQYLIANGDSYTQYASMDEGKSFQKVENLEDGLETVEASFKQSDATNMNPDYFELTKEGSNYVLEGEPTLKEIADDPNVVESLNNSGVQTDFANMEGNLPMRMVIDGNDFHVVELYMDMSDAMQGSLEGIVDQGEEAPQTEIEFNMTVKNMKVNDVEPIVLPEAAKNATDMQPMPNADPEVFPGN